MRKLSVFNLISIDGYFVDRGGDMSWAHRPDPDFDAFTEGNAKEAACLVFGRITYELMAGYWPTPIAMRNYPVVAERMNSLPKVVFSRTLTGPAWRNTTVAGGDIPAELKKLKAMPGPDLVIMGSGTVISQAAPFGVIDEYQLVAVPIVLGGGRTLFEGMKDRLPLRLRESRAFPNGNVFLRYEPA